MLTLKYFFAKYELTTKGLLFLTGVLFVLFTAMPAMGQTGEIIRNEWNRSQLFVPAFLLLICMGAQVLIAASLGIYFLRRCLKSGSVKRPGILTKALNMWKNEARRSINSSPFRRAA